MPEPSSHFGQLRSGSPRAAVAIWRWQDGGDSAGKALGEARRRLLRREGVIRALIGGALGCGLFYFGAIVFARVAWGGAALVLLAALISPAGLYAAIGRGLEHLGYGIGRLLAIAFLTPVFLLFFVPFGLLLRSGRRDRLERWFEPAAPTYWHRRSDPPRTKSSYEKAF